MINDAAGENANIIKKSDKAQSRNMVVLYLLCIIVPLIITDGIFIFLLVKGDKTSAKFDAERSAKAIEYEFESSIDYAINMSKNITMSGEINDFLEEKYESDIEYFKAYKSVSGNTYLKNLYNVYNVSLEIYADNDTLIQGGGIYPLSAAENTGWYRQFLDSGKDALVTFYYDEDGVGIVKPKRKLIYIHRMKYYQHGRVEKVLKLDLDYTTLARNFEASAYNPGGFICQGDRICVSTFGSNNVYEDFKNADIYDAAFDYDFTTVGCDFSVHILPESIETVGRLKNNAWYLIGMIVINAAFPLVFIRLSQNLQRERIKQQEADIARQNAELLALHSQINPHFLFNALESIRMHSVLKGEEETAEMVQKLAVIERINADWDKDFTTVTDEMNFVEAYLKLQQYRFGERLNYEIEIEEKCRNIRLPRLTIVTFAENACIHGIEGKSSPGWIFVRVYTKNQELIIEVEDTGEGIENEQLKKLRDKMENASFEMLTQRGRIGIVNACLRLKMETDNSVSFEVDSEVGIGTIISIHIPMDKLKGGVSC